MALFRISQEALINIVKHAKAKHAFVNVTQDKDDIILEILDDGIGFDMKSLNSANKATWGLLGMQERAALLGGNFSVDSALGKGTKLRISIPCCQELQEEVGDED